jgi:2-C-methyl-D-erythritol 4-phosphate cytidylyltransferase
MKKIAVIVAGGKGTRMNNDLPKQFILLKNKPVLYYTIKAFLDAYVDMEIILVLPSEHIGKGQEIIDGYFPSSLFRLCEGGSTRFNSVQNGLALIEDESIIFVHDGVRCLLTSNIVKRCFEAAVEKGTAIPAIDSKDSLRLLTAKGNKVLDRNKVNWISNISLKK